MLRFSGPPGHTCQSLEILEFTGFILPIAADQIDQVLKMSNLTIGAAAARHMAILSIGNEYKRRDIPGN